MRKHLKIFVVRKILAFFRIKNILRKIIIALTAILLPLLLGIYPVHSQSGYTRIVDWGNQFPDVYVNNAFTKQERAALSHSFSLLVGAMYVWNPTNGKVRSCFERYGNNVYVDSTITGLVGQSPKAARVINHFDLYFRDSPNSKVYVDRENNRQIEWRGQAPLGITKRNGEFKFKINIAYFPNLVQRASNENWNATSRDEQYQLTGVLLHEMLHNLGYSHDKDGNTVRDGNTVYESGWCVSRSGENKTSSEIQSYDGFKLNSSGKSYFVD